MIIYSYKGGSLHGHLRIIMTNNDYLDVAAVVLPARANPGAMSTIVAGMMAAQVAETNRAHVEATCVYHTYHNMVQAFKKLIIYAFKDPFLNALSDEAVGYENWTSLQFITHLLTYYALIAHTETTHNYERHNTPYDPNRPI
jgi:hypothetical protein